MTLTEFLLARIAEDGAAARAAIEPEPRTRKLFDGREVTEVDEGAWTAGPLDGYDECRIEGTFMVIYDEGGHTGEQARHIARHDPARVLAECAAKRRMVDLSDAVEHEVRNLAGTPAASIALARQSAVDVTLRALATIWADHEEYDTEWRL